MWKNENANRKSILLSLNEDKINCEHRFSIEIVVI